MNVTLKNNCPVCGNNSATLSDAVITNGGQFGTMTYGCGRKEVLHQSGAHEVLIQCPITTPAKTASQSDA